MLQREEEFESRIQATEDFLHAASHGRLEPMVRALDQGAQVNALRSDRGALMGTVAGRYLECAQVLLQRGADPNQKNRVWWTCLHEAAAKDFPEFIAPLVAAGANLDAQDAPGATPLHAAVRNKSLVAARALIQAGACLDVVDYDGLSVLMLAVGVEEPGLLELLLARGANPGLVDRQGRTASQMARESGWAMGAAMLDQASRPSMAPAPTDQQDPPQPFTGALAESDSLAPKLSRITKRPGA